MQLQVPITFEAVDMSEGQSIVSAMLEVLKEYGIKAKAGAIADAVSISPDCVLVHTDGGCDLSKDGIGAWAYVMEGPLGGSVTMVEKSGCYIGTTNNRMEMMAVIRALEDLPFGQPIKVVSDSEYVIKGITQWVRNWVRNNWRTRDGKPVVNRDLWERLLALYQLHAVTFEHVKGHSGHPQNERCDQLCTIEMTNGHKDALAGNPPEADEGCVQRKDFEPQARITAKGELDEL